MSRPYGNTPRGGRRQPEAALPVEIQVNMRERHTMEQLALEVQRALAMVEEFGAFGVESFRFRLLPLDADGRPVILRDGQGKAVTAIHIPEQGPDLFTARTSQASAYCQPPSLSPQRRCGPLRSPVHERHGEKARPG